LVDYDKKEKVYKPARRGVKMPRGGNAKVADDAWKIGVSLGRPIHIYDVIDRLKMKPMRTKSRTHLRMRIPTPNQLAQVFSRSGWFDKVGTTRVDGREVCLYLPKSLDELIETKVKSGVQTRTDPKKFPQFLKDEIKRRGLDG
tara:strand:+ start:3533 stop:3961 length:429 start_codon:yes stop_codon:yes gene_type:complete